MKTMIIQTRRTEFRVDAPLRVRLVVRHRGALQQDGRLGTRARLHPKAHLDALLGVVEDVVLDAVHHAPLKRGRDHAVDVPAPHEPLQLLFLFAFV